MPAATAVGGSADGYVGAVQGRERGFDLAPEPVDSLASSTVPDRKLYETFSREELHARRAAIPLSLGRDDFDDIRALHVQLDLAEVESVYLPLAPFVNLHVNGVRSRRTATDTFLGRCQDPVPYVIGVAGSVA